MTQILVNQQTVTVHPSKITRDKMSVCHGTWCSLSSYISVADAGMQGVWWCGTLWGILSSAVHLQWNGV